jgi:nitroreductase
MLKELIQKNRSYRRFHEEVAIGRETLLELIDMARLSASSGNLQPLKYLLADSPYMNEKIFPHLQWAGYLTDWPGPAKGERPSAYIVILHDTKISKTINCDHGIAAQSILLGATKRGLGGCIIASMNKSELIAALKIPEHLQILLVIALGKPNEKVKIEEIDVDGDIKYWRDEKGVHHVPKRKLKDILL